MHISFYNIIVLSLFFSLHIESIIFFVYRRVWLSPLIMKQRLITNKQLEVFLLPPSLFWIIYTFCFVFSKDLISYNIGANYCWSYIFLFYWIFFLWYNLVFYFFKLGISINIWITFLLENFLFGLILLLFITNLLEFLFIIEFYSSLYYFFFLQTTIRISKISVQSYKQLLLFYLWNSFSTTIIYGYGLLGLVYYYGTLNYSELSCFTQMIAIWPYHFIFFSLSWKLGLPSIHFFKIELYRYLDPLIIFFFSGITTVLNIFLFYFYIMQPIMLNYLYLSNYYFIFFFSFFIIFLLLYRWSNFYNFLALSSLITATTALLIVLF